MRATFWWSVRILVLVEVEMEEKELIWEVTSAVFWLAVDDE